MTLFSTISGKDYKVYRKIEKVQQKRKETAKIKCHGIISRKDITNMPSHPHSTPKHRYAHTRTRAYVGKQAYTQNGNSP
jgi:hypothetical protein